MNSDDYRKGVNPMESTITMDSENGNEHSIRGTVQVPFEVKLNGENCVTTPA